MSCGNPHATACAEVLAFVYVYIDEEIDETHRVEVWTHLQECPPCSREYEAEVRLKARVGQCCRMQPAPVELRSRIVSEIQRISISYRAEVTVEQDWRSDRGADDQG
jgi:anti-sigma factor (TIGR02949 family)